MKQHAAAQIILRSVLVPLDLTEIFGRAAPLEVDLGCGDGTFLAELAAQNPQTNFLGVERLAGRVASACRKMGLRRLTNARILHHDILETVQQLLAPASVDVFHLMFPDPWPKRRHYRRRTVNESFLRAISRALKPSGEFHITTDHAEYFAAIRSALQEFPMLAVAASNDSLGKPFSTFEKHFRQSGASIHRLVLRKVWPERNGIASQRSP